MRELETRAATRRPVLIAAAVLVLLASCYSSSYPRGAAANVALLSQLADKLADYCQSGFLLSGRPVSSEEMGEFYYALRKARSFSAMSETHSPQRSWQEFSRLLSSYEAFVKAADEYRLAGQPDPARLAALMARRDQVRLAARRVLAALHSES